METIVLCISLRVFILNVILICIIYDIAVDSLKDFLKTKPEKPTFLVVDNVMYADWINCFQQCTCDVKHFADIITDLNLNGLIFDGMYPVSQ